MSGHSLEPIPVNKFKRFLQYVLCEERGARHGHCVYWRDDLKYPIQFRADYDLVPVAQILSCLRTLNITTAKYLSILDDLFP